MTGSIIAAKSSPTERNEASLPTVTTVAASTVKEPSPISTFSGLGTIFTSGAAQAAAQSPNAHTSTKSRFIFVEFFFV